MVKSPLDSKMATPRGVTDWFSGVYSEWLVFGRVSVISPPPGVGQNLCGPAEFQPGQPGLVGGAAIFCPAEMPLGGIKRRTAVCMLPLPFADITDIP